MPSVPSHLPSVPPCSDVSNNSLYGRISHNFNSMVADGDALINLAHNFFYGDAVLFAAGCQVCPEEIPHRNQLQLGDSSVRVAGMCSDTASGSLRDYSVAGAGKGARGSLAGNCLTVKRDNKCPSNATQRSTAACQAFCSITDNGPCDGHGACVPPAPAAPANSGYQTPVTNFTCMCDAGYSSVDLGNGSTCAIVNSTTTAAGEAPAHMHNPSGVHAVLTSHLPSAALPVALLRLNLLHSPPLFPHPAFFTPGSVLAFNSKIANNAPMSFILFSHLFPVRPATMPALQLTLPAATTAAFLLYLLAQTLAKYPLSLRQRLRLAQGSAEGLAYLHGFGTPIIHRDIKPANILVSSDMTAKVADFGLLKQLTHGDAHATRVAGTPGYVDPDYNRTGVITAKSDVFSPGYAHARFNHDDAPCTVFPPYDATLRLSSVSCHLLLHCLLRDLTPSPIYYAASHRLFLVVQAQQRVDAYEPDELKDSNLQASDEAVVDFADLALDCMKAPGTRRPEMKDVAYRLRALIDKHCPDKEEEWECGKEESVSTGKETSTTTNPGNGSSLLSSNSSGIKSWLSLRFSWGY
ncbi:unnamed protein product [Closterium sp. Yama58-4]|nr:unnamed protein product [Closterium sp. Yama58-4]